MLGHISQKKGLKRKIKEKKMSKPGEEKKENCVGSAMITKYFQDTKSEYFLTYVFSFIEFVKSPW